MTTLVLGTVGAAIGSYFGPIGAELGFLAGSFLGNLIDPPKVAGPRLGDTKLQRSTYGAMLPYCWGAGRIGTIVIDQTDLIEHENKTDAGKGGSQTTNFTYSASWLAALCVKLPNKDSAIAGISHLFLDGRLIWAADSDGDCPCEVFTGTETQLPDADFEAINGVGKQPAYRGMAYLKFKDFSLTDYGNRIPNVEAVAFTAGVAGAFPTRVGAEFAPWGQDTPATPYLNKGGFTSSYTDGLITTSWTRRLGGTTLEIWVAQYLINGTTIMMPTLAYTGPTPSTLFYVTADTNSHQWFYEGPSSSDYAWLKLFYSTGKVANGNYAQVSLMHGWSAAANDDIVALTAYPNSMASGHVQSTKAGVLYYTARQGVSPCVIVRSDTFPFGAVYKHLADLDPDGGLYAASDVSIGLGTDDQTLYAMTTFGGGHKLWRFGGRGDHFWNVADTAGTQLSSSYDFFVYQNKWIVFSGGSPSHVRIVQINTDETLEDVGTPLAQGISGGPCRWLGSIYGIDFSGVFKLGGLGGGPVPLSEIVDDLATLTPAATYDNTELTDLVRWFLIGNQMTVRNALDKLRTPFFFDIVEEDYSLNARKRGDRTVYPVLDVDLDCRPYGNAPGDPLQTERTREQELPRTVSMAYIDVDLDWQTGVQGSPRQTSESEYDVSLEVPVGFTAQEAAQKCWAIQVGAWTEREKFKWTLSRKYSFVTPCTLVKVRGRIIRVTKVTESPVTGILSFEGVLAAASIYTQVAPGATGSGGQGSQGGPPGSGGGGGGGANPGDPGYHTPPPGGLVDPWQYMLVDCPALHAGDAPFGFYMAVSQVYGVYYWGGADLYRTTDFGETWTYLGTKKGNSVMGLLAGAELIGTEPPHDPTVLNAAYAGGDVTQEVTVVMYVASPFQLLTSTTEAGLDAGANLIYMSASNAFGNPLNNNVTLPQKWECMQFRDVTQLAHGFWKVTGFRRGRRNTALLDHNADGTASSWFAPESVANIVDAEENLNKTFTYKVVPFGYTTLQAPAFQFTNYGESGGGSNAGGGAGPPTAPGGGNAPGNGSFDTIALNFPVTTQIKTATSYTFVTNDRASLMVFINAATITATLPDPAVPATALPKKWWCWIQNDGAGDLVLDPAGIAKLDTSTSSLTVSTGKGLLLVFDGTDYWTSRGMGITSIPAATQLVNAQSGTTYTIVAGDASKLVTSNNASAVAWTLPQATGLFGAGFFFDVRNLGAGTLTITPTTSTIQGATTLVLVQGNSCRIVSDGTNYQVVFTPHMIVLSPAYAATVTVDLSLYKAYDRVQVDVGTLTGNVTFNISNGRGGQIINATFTQDGTGSRIFTAGANLAFSVDIPSVTLTTAINKSDETAWRWHAASGKARCMAVNKGF